MKKITEGQFDEERAFYNEKDLVLEHVHIDGPADGESALKECVNLQTLNCFFNLRYPFWHCENVEITKCSMTELCRAALWYTSDVKIASSKLLGIKALRECKNIFIKDSLVKSPEFGWRCDEFEMSNVTIESEYLLFETKNIKAKDLSMKGKYSFQYIENALFDHCSFDTKDAFWHSKNVLVRNSYVKGEYLGWYAENLTFVNCIIEGTQPLCYCKNLKLIDCKMVGTDLSFERSVVDASLIGHVDSIKNPLKGSRILLDSVGDIILDIDAEFGEIKKRK